MYRIHAERLRTKGTFKGLWLPAGYRVASYEAARSEARELRRQGCRRVWIETLELDQAQIEAGSAQPRPR